MYRLLLLTGAMSFASAETCGATVDWYDMTSVESALAKTVSCDTTFMSITINTCVLEEAGFDPSSDITVNGLSDVSQECPDASLNKNYVSGSQEITFTLSDPFTDCNTVTSYQNNDMTYVYSNALSVFQFSNLNDADITRHRHIYLYFSCEYAMKYEDVGIADSTNYPIEVVQDPHKGAWQNTSAEFDYTVQACSDAGCSGLINAGDQVDILQTIYVRITTQKILYLYLKDVVVQSDTTAAPAHSYNIMDSAGCIAVAERGTTTDVTYAESSTVLQWDAFIFAEASTPNQYVTLTMTLCDPSDETCEDPCNEEGINGRRRRRDAALFKEKPTVTATLGPWKTV